MGLCMSSGGAARAAAASGEAAAPPSSKDTALVLMPGGELREYPRPATAAWVLGDVVACASGARDSSSWFLCDADGMGFEGPVPAVPAAEPLRPGQIYFVLPSAALRHGLRREEVAALAVSASAALSSRAAAAAPGRRRRGAVAPLIFAPPMEEDEHETSASAAACKAAATAPAPAPAPRRPAPRARSGRRLERFASDLTAIPECEAASD